MRNVGTARGEVSADCDLRGLRIDANSDLLLRYRNSKIICRLIAFCFGYTCVTLKLEAYFLFF